MVTATISTPVRFAVALLTALFGAATSRPAELPGKLCGLGKACPCSQFAAAHTAMGSSMPGMNTSNASGQAQGDPTQMPGMQTSQTKMGAMNMGAPSSFIDAILGHSTSGTSAEPISTPHPMLMKRSGSWMLMLHGDVFVNAIQQSGPRGMDKVFSTSWLMPMAQRSLGPGTLTLRGMFSLEPATVTDRRYPELFQVGETAYGRPIVDGQHPHDLFMELAALYDIKLGENGLFSIYAAPVGDPAIGPEAYPHRVSASEDPLAALGHHLEDSTHISYDVVTLGLTYKIARIEVSGFHGQEPGENRWTIGAANIDSWATRLTVSPAANWSGQYSISRLHSPEQLFPTEDTLRMTASIMYNRPFANGSGNWASTLLWGSNKDFPGGEVFNGYLAESTVKFAHSNYAWTRVENVDRTNLLELGENPLQAGFEEHFVARVQAYTFGYDHEWNFVPRVSSALGGQVTLYGKPAFLDPTYGDHPAGFLLFVRLRPVPTEKRN